ncbi:MAG TPA: chemotaxis protein CheW [Rectinemataceae bacterium]|nr:chemotaxis protein CheW [Rectinemataceae bacterium]
MESRPIDWESIKSRLAGAAALTSGERSPGAEEIRRILEKRARAAAKPPEKPDGDEKIEFLAFSLAGERYAVETRFVRETCQLKDLTPIPCTPPYLAGAINLRGRILAIVDLRVFFELPIKGLTELNKIIVLKEGDKEFGLLADSIDGVGRVARSDLQEDLAALAGMRESFLKGITKGMMALLDGGRLLADSSLTVDEQTSK